MTTKEQGYVLGHSGRELERLRRQAKLVDPITRAFFVEAGIGPGMRVLDLGSGGGDVSLLVADLVGPKGEVVGVDRSADGITRAEARVRSKGLTNVSFVRSELSAVNLEGPFDAAVGRYVLCFLPDVPAVLRRIAKLIRPGGCMVFHEPDRSTMHSVPPAPSYDNSSRWSTETYLRSGADVLVGTKLYSMFVAAGLPPPTMRLHAIIGGATATDEIHLDADQAEILAADMERYGIATREQLGVETLAARITRELEASNGIIIGRGEIGAWARLPS
jgi:ubiquinone/menaquinone biosynthesis C-methylase UbiE